MNNITEKGAVVPVEGNNPPFPAITPLSNNELIDKFYNLSCLVELAIFAVNAENGTHSTHYALSLLDSELVDLSNRYEELEAERRVAFNEFEGLYSQLPPLEKRISADLMLAIGGGNKKEIKKAKKLSKEYTKFRKFKMKTSKADGK